MQKILAYLTVYQDKKATELCLEGIKNQFLNVDQILIVDNSEELLLEETDNLIVKHYPENIGVGSGLKKAIEYAIQEKYDFVWTFDQDSIPTKKCLQNLMFFYRKLTNSNYKIGIIAPTPIDLNNHQMIRGVIFKKNTFKGLIPSNQQTPYECDAPITSGSLISIRAAKTIELPREDLFIDGVDLDYGYRLKQRGFHNIIIPNAIMYHNFGHPKTVTFLNKNIVYQQYVPLRYYYICRNHTYLELQFSEGIYKITCLTKRFKYLIYTVVKILLYEEQDKKSRIFACLLGTYHGLIGKLGKFTGL